MRTPDVDCDICIFYIQLVLVLYQEFMILYVLLIELYQEESQLFLIFIGKNVECSIILLKNDLFNSAYFEQFINVNLAFGVFVDVETFILCRNDKDVLVIVHVEESWLQIERVVEPYHSFRFLCIPIKSEDLFLSRKNDCISHKAIIIFEVEIHTNFLEHIVFLDNNSFLEFKLLITIFLEYEHLFDPLLPSDQVISCDNSKILLILALLNGQHLVDLSLTVLWCQQGHL